MKTKKADKTIEKHKKKLGKKICTLRGEMSQRELAKKINLPNSNLKYIEDGVNAPTNEVYEKIIDTLSPPPKERKEMDKLFSLIRNTPPPDVCNIIIKTEGMNEAIRLIDGIPLNSEQLERVKELFISLKKENEGVLKNGRKQVF